MVKGGCAIGAYGCNGCIVCLVVLYVVATIMFLANMGSVDDYAGGWADVAKDEELIAACKKPAASGCDISWMQYEGSCYFIEKGRMTWGKGRVKCNARGAHLATIESPDENAKVKDLCEKAAGDSWGCWIGLHQPQGGTDKDTFVWVENGQRPTWENWKGSEPNDSGGGEEEDATALMLDRFVELAKGSRDFAAFIGVFILILLIIVCSAVVVMSVAGVQQDNVCCITCGAVGHGICGGLLFLAAFGAVMRGDFAGTLLNLLIGCTMIVTSVIGCCLCNQANQKAAAEAPVAGGTTTVIGQPVQGMVVR